MNQLITEANGLLKNKGFEYSICGGLAIDLFLNRETRIHGDIDILAYWDERDIIIESMKKDGWNVYELCGGGKAHHITNVKEQYRCKRNIFCIKPECTLVELEFANEKDMYLVDFLHIGQKKLDFIEFLFNDKEDGYFLYARNKRLKRELPKAILQCEDFSYLAPELVLLYKSTDIEREGYQSDFDYAINKMNISQIQWLKEALKIMFPDGHKWLSLMSK